MIRRRPVQRIHKYEGWLSDDDMNNAKKDALLEAIEDSDAALELLNKVLLRLGDAVRKASDYGNAGDEVMPIRDILNKIRLSFRLLRCICTCIRLGIISLTWAT